MKAKLFYIFIFAFLFRFLFSFTVWHPDVRNHMDWGVRFFSYGPGKFYGPEANIWNYTWPNQPPGTIYIFAAIRKLFELLFSVFWFVNTHIPLFPSQIMFFLESNLYPALLKLPSILADVGIAWLIFKIFKDQKREKLGILGAALFLFNPVIWYNSAIWGQTDSVINFFVFLAFCLLMRKRLSLAILSIIISLYIKISLLIFLPIFVLFVVKKKFSRKDILVPVIFVLIFIGVFTLPFSKGEPFSWLCNLYTQKVLSNQLQVITANAFNIWATISGVDEKPQSLKFIVISYQIWGYLLFLILLIPVLYLVWRRKLNDNLFCWSLAVVAFGAFIFLTNMHERYLYPLFPYLTVLAIENKEILKMYVLISVVSLLNLYNSWWVPRIDLLIYFLSFGDKLMPRIFGLLNTILFVFLFRKFLRARS